MAPFSDLPREVVLMIAHAASCFRDMAALSRTTKKMYALLSPELYEVVERKGLGKRVLFWGVSSGLLTTVKMVLDARRNSFDVAGPDLMWHSDLLGLGSWDANKYLRGINNRMVLGSHSSRVATATSSKGQRWHCLHVAAACGYDTMVKLLLDRGVPVDVQGFWSGDGVTRPISNKRFGGTPLRVAIIAKRESTARLLVENGAVVDLVDGQQDPKRAQQSTALHMACGYGLLPLARLLVEGGYQKRLNQKDSFGDSPLDYAFQRHQGHCFDWLLRQGARINTGLGDYGHQKLLFAACESHRFDAALRLIGSGIDTSTVSATGFTISLLRACLNRHWRTSFNQSRLQKQMPENKTLADMLEFRSQGLTLLERLVSLGSDLEATGPDNTGMTALMLALFNANDEAALLLLKAGARVNARDKNRHTPLSLACVRLAKTRDTHMIRRLLEYGADVNRVVTAGWTPLSLICTALSNEQSVEHREAARMLLDHGANPLDSGICRNSERVSALEESLRKGDFAMARVLIASCRGNPTTDASTVYRIFAIISQPVHPGRYAMRFSTIDMNPPCLDLLLEMDKDNHLARDEKCMDLLIRNSIWWTTPTLVTGLLETASFGALPAFNKTLPLCSAIRYNRDCALAKILLEAGADPNHAPKRRPSPCTLAFFAYKTDKSYLDLLLQYGAAIQVPLADENWTDQPFALGPPGLSMAAMASWTADFLVSPPEHAWPHNPLSALNQYGSEACRVEAEPALVALLQAVKRPSTESHREDLGRLLVATLNVAAMLKCDEKGEAVWEFETTGPAKREYFDMNHIVHIWDLLVGHGASWEVADEFGMKARAKLLDMMSASSLLPSDQNDATKAEFLKRRIRVVERKVTFTTVE